MLRSAGAAIVHRPRIRSRAMIQKLIAHPMDNTPSKPRAFLRKFFHYPDESKCFALGLSFFTLNSFMLFLAMLLSSLPELYTGRAYTCNGTDWDCARMVIECVSMFVISIEFLLRWGSHRNVLTYPFRLMTIVDIVVIVAFLHEIITSRTDLQYLQCLRVVRVFNYTCLFRATRFKDTFLLLKKTAITSMQALLLMVFLKGIGLILFSSVMHYVERGSFDSTTDTWRRDDGTKSPFQSILMSMYYTMTTLTTVGYGNEDVPVEDLGKIFGTVTMLSGILIIALPLSIITSNLVDNFEEKEQQDRDKEHHKRAMALRKLEMKKMENLLDDEYADEGLDEESEEILKQLSGKYGHIVSEHLSMAQDQNKKPALRRKGSIILINNETFLRHSEEHEQRHVDYHDCDGTNISNYVWDGKIHPIREAFAEFEATQNELDESVSQFTKRMILCEARQRAREAAASVEAAVPTRLQDVRRHSLT